MINFEQTKLAKISSGMYCFLVNRSQFKKSPHLPLRRAPTSIQFILTNEARSPRGPQADASQHATVKFTYLKHRFSEAEVLVKCFDTLLSHILPFHFIYLFSSPAHCVNCLS